MADSDDLELGSEGDPSAGTTSSGHATHPIRKRIAIKLRQGGKSGKKSKLKPARDAINEGSQVARDSEDGIHFGDDVDKTMQFVPVKIGGTPGEPFHKNQKLKWDHKVNLLGEKVVDPLIHSCEKCSLPILLYGRMIPCKHVFCYSCAKTTDKSCPRCSQNVVRIEQAALGTVFVCTFGGTKHGVSGCHRTYLSPDLQSHIAHRHLGAGRESAGPRVVPPEILAATGAARPTGSGALLTYSVNQPIPPIIGDGPNLVFRPHHPPAPSGPVMAPIVVSRPPLGISQQQVPPSQQHILSQHGPHVIGTNPPSMPPVMMQTSHASGMPPPPSVTGMAKPQPMLVQTLPVGVTAVRPTNLITVKLQEENDYRRSTDNALGSAGRPQFASQPPPTHDNPLPHFTQQHFSTHGPPPVSFSQTQEHHQMNVRPLITHPPGGPPPQTHPAGMVGIPPGQMGPPGAPPQRLGPPPQSIHSVPPQNIVPSPQPVHAGPPQRMHAGPPGIQTGPPPQAIHVAHPQPPQGMHSGPPPSLHSGPPQGIHSGPPPPQALRSGPPPPGFPAPARHPQDQHVQFTTGQQMTWPNAGPMSGQVQRIAIPPGSRPSPGPSQSMPFYQ